MRCRAPAVRRSIKEIDRKRVIDDRGIERSPKSVIIRVTLISPLAQERLRQLAFSGSVPQSLAIDVFLTRFGLTSGAVQPPDRIQPSEARGRSTCPPKSFVSPCSYAEAKLIRNLTTVSRRRCY